jgi:hypothetical protein
VSLKFPRPCLQLIGEENRTGSVGPGRQQPSSVHHNQLTSIREEENSGGIGQAFKDGSLGERAKGLDEDRATLGIDPVEVVADRIVGEAGDGAESCCHLGLAASG